ncbi:MAG: hypothetical protein RO469_03245 [Thermincola sp.]|jgi:hypothetical protein|nr:hypothetical protein [Thermincola sp.]MDT3702398.1 hypothetical protein [Thermincola sp.]
MTVVAKKAPTRQEKLAQAKIIFGKVQERTASAGVSHIQLKEQVNRIRNEVRENRRTNSNRY